MKGLINAPAIYLYRESVDFRKSINGLAALVESETNLPLDTGALFLFTNKQRDKMKVLYWDKTGFALWYKRLEKAKFKWPSQEQNQVANLSRSDYSCIQNRLTQLEESLGILVPR